MTRSWYRRYMLTCPELTTMAQQIAAPFQHMVTALNPGGAPCVTHRYFPSNDIQAFPPNLPCKVPVSRTVLGDAAQLNIGLALLSQSYDPAFKSCHAVSAWRTPAGRVQALKPIEVWAASKGFTATNPLSYAARALLLTILDDPTGSRSGSRMTEVVAAAAEVVRVSKTPFFDAALWIPLWTWAVGGPAGAASVRTRVFAMKAIQAVLARGTLLPGQIRAADSLAAVLDNIVRTGAPTVPAAEREFYRSEAAATVGAAAQALVVAETAAAAGLTPALPASPPAVRWPTVLGLGLGAAGVAIGIGWAIRRRAGAAA